MKTKREMKILFAAISVVVVLTLSCGQVSQKTDLESMFPTIPAELASNNILWFSNMEKIMEMAGIETGIEPNEYVNKETEPDVYQLRMDLLSGYTLSDFSGGRYLEYWSDAFGFDAFDTKQEVWISQPVLKGTRPLFSVMKGNFDKNDVIEKLDTIGYQIKEHASIDYYSINEDYSLGGPGASKAVLMAGPFLNRIMVTEREIIATPADEIFFPILDFRSDKNNSLKDSLPYTRVAEALGDVLGAALIPQSTLSSENVRGDWGTLHKYDLASIGYRVEGQSRGVVIALHYPNDAAADDIDELSRRMAEYAPATGSKETNYLSELFDIGEPKAIIYGPDSVLKVELVYKPETPSTLWSFLVEARDLGFLVVNPSE